MTEQPSLREFLPQKPEDYELKTSLDEDGIERKVHEAVVKALTAEGAKAQTIAEAVVMTYKSIDPKIPEKNLDYIRFEYGAKGGLLVAAKKQYGLDKVLKDMEKQRTGEPQTLDPRTTSKALTEGIIAAVSDTNASPESITAAMKTKILELMPETKNDPAKLKMLEELLPKEGQKLFDSKKTRGLDKTIELIKILGDYKAGLPVDQEKLKTLLESNQKKNGIPYGTLGGAAAGLAASSALDIGNWTSFSGILKKISMIAAGAGIGLMAMDEYGARSAVMGMVSGKKPEGASK